eukprot:scaffold42171_cov35-Attheya_sp.AAC.1
MEEGEKSHQDRKATDNEEHENGNTSIISRSSSVSANIANSVGEIQEQEATEAPNSDRNESDQHNFHVGDGSSRYTTS